MRDAVGDAAGGTQLGGAINVAAQQNEYDRMIVITDEQAHDTVSCPKIKLPYMINVGTDRNGVGYGRWVHLDGFSEAVINWMIEYEGLIPGHSTAAKQL